MKNFKTGYWLLIIPLFILTSCGKNKENIEIPVIDTGIEMDTWVKIPEGPFFRGQHNKETLLEYDFEIMTVNVTNSQYAEYLNDAVDSGSIQMVDDTLLAYHEGDPFNNYNHEVKIEDGLKILLILEEEGGHIYHNDEEGFYVEKGYSNHPVVNVSWYGAKSYCNYFGWDLPLENEWEKAARGEDKRAYPWGNLVESNLSNYYSSGDPFESLFGKMGGTTPVGFYNGKEYLGYKTINAVSPYGLYDMAGNTWEWTADDYSNVHYRYMRGGSNANYEPDLRIWIRNSAGPEFRSINVGFRCVRR